jgi:hypothetical protein
MCSRLERDQVGGATRWNSTEQLPDERHNYMLDILGMLDLLANEHDTG